MCVYVVGNTVQENNAAITTLTLLSQTQDQANPRAGENQHLHLLPLPVQLVDVMKQPHIPASVQKECGCGTGGCDLAMNMVVAGLMVGIDDLRDLFQP